MIGRMWDRLDYWSIYDAPEQITFFCLVIAPIVALVGLAGMTLILGIQ